MAVRVPIIQLPAYLWLSARRIELEASRREGQRMRKSRSPEAHHLDFACAPAEDSSGEARVHRKIIGHLLAGGEAYAEAVTRANAVVRARRLRIDQGHISLGLASQRRVPKEPL
jgi:hypothetical protein